MYVSESLDVVDEDDETRYQMIRGHLMTRAVENVTPVLSVNAIDPNQTAPTCFINASVSVCKELEKNTAWAKGNFWGKVTLKFIKRKNKK